MSDFREDLFAHGGEAGVGSNINCSGESLATGRVGHNALQPLSNALSYSAFLKSAPFDEADISGSISHMKSGIDLF